MSIAISAEPRADLIYPDSDGQPMADNTVQFDYMTTIKGGLDILLRLAGDLIPEPYAAFAAQRVRAEASLQLARSERDLERARADRLAARLQELGVDPTE
jgi:hypothetical protein